VIVTTAIYGGYDDLKPHPNHPKVDEWVCYTDDESLLDNPKSWRVVHVPGAFAHPRLNAKWWKCHPRPYADSLWIDGSVEIRSADFIDEVVACLDVAPMTMWVHPWRDCIYDEVGASAPMVKYHGLKMVEQVTHYRSTGWPEHAGLWASTVIGWRPEPHVRAMAAAWFAHNEAFTYQDQLSLPYLLNRYGIAPAPLPGKFVDRRWVTWHGHRSDL
jgi:hypothetical protein